MNDELFNEYMKYITSVDLSSKNNIIAKEDWDCVDGTSDTSISTAASTSDYFKFGQLGHQGTTSMSNYEYTTPSNGWYSHDYFNSGGAKDIEVIEKEAFFKINKSITKKDIIGWEIICVKDLDFSTSNFRQCFTTIPEAWVSKFDLYVEVISQELCIYVSPDYDRYIAGDEELVEAVEKILRSEKKYSELDYDALKELLDEVNKQNFIDGGYLGNGSSGTLWHGSSADTILNKSFPLYDIDTPISINSSGSISIDSSGGNITTAISSTGE